jgi:hypothetical protein
VKMSVLLCSRGDIALHVTYEVELGLLRNVHVYIEPEIHVKVYFAFCNTIPCAIKTGP